MLGVIKTFKKVGQKLGAEDVEIKAPVLKTEKEQIRGDLIVAEVARRQGKLAIAGRYSAQRELESDITLDERVVGTGMSGDVRLARYAGTEQFCTVKTLNKSGLSVSRTSEITAEVETFLSVDHPNICRLERLYESKEHLHFVMELLEGGELFAAVEQSRFPEARGVEIFRQMLLAVCYLHEHQIVHCDLKLENFMFEREGSDHIKLIDFGLAKRYTGEKITQCCGSMHYVAPEVINCNFDEKADMWSLGVTLYMMLCGAMPWRGDNDEVARRIKAGEPYFHPPLWRRLSPGAKSLIEGLMTLDPAKRLSAQDALRHPWISMRKGVGALVVDRAVARSLSDFARVPALRRACLSMAVWSLPVQDIESLRRQFYALDRDCNGVVTIEDLNQALGSCCPKHLQSAQSTDNLELFASLDMNGDGEVTFSEFLAAAVNSRRKRLGDTALQLTFDRFDCDASGSLSLDNFFDVLVDSVTGRGLELLEGVELTVNGSMVLEDFRSFMLGVVKDKECSDEETCADSSEDLDASNDGLSEASVDMTLSDLSGEGFPSKACRRVEPSVGCYSQVFGMLRQVRGNFEFSPVAPNRSSQSCATADSRYRGSARSHLGPAILGM